MKKLIISPYARGLANGQINAKNYPYWRELVEALNSVGIHTIQIGVIGEMTIGCKEDKVGASFKELQDLLNSADGWIAVDNFFPHFCHYHKKPGIVLWGKSDPEIFGYPENINMLKDRKNLRQYQYNIWDEEQYNQEVFFSMEEVFFAVQEYLENASVFSFNLDKV